MARKPDEIIVMQYLHPIFYIFVILKMCMHELIVFLVLSLTAVVPHC